MAELTAHPTFLSSLAEACKNKVKTPRSASGRMLRRSGRRQQPPPPIAIPDAKVLPRDIIRKASAPSLLPSPQSSPASAPLSVASQASNASEPATPFWSVPMSALNLRSAKSETFSRSSCRTLHDDQQDFCAFDEEEDAKANWDFKCCAGRRRRRVYDSAGSSCSSVYSSVSRTSITLSIRSSISSVSEYGVEIPTPNAADALIELPTNPGVRTAGLSFAERSTKREGMIFNAASQRSLNANAFTRMETSELSRSVGSGCLMNGNILSAEPKTGANGSPLATSQAKMPSLTSYASFDSLQTIRAPRAGTHTPEKTSALIAALGLETGNSCTSLAAMSSVPSSYSFSSGRLFMALESTSTLRSLTSPKAMSKTIAQQTNVMSAARLEKSGEGDPFAGRKPFPLRSVNSNIPYIIPPLGFTDPVPIPRKQSCAVNGPTKLPSLTRRNARPRSSSRALKENALAVIKRREKDERPRPSASVTSSC